VKKGGFGLLVNPEKIDELCDAILKLKHNKKLRERLSEKAKSTSKTYNWPFMEKKLLQIYENL